MILSQKCGSIRKESHFNQTTMINVWFQSAQNRFMYQFKLVLCESIYTSTILCTICWSKDTPRNFDSVFHVLLKKMDPLCTGNIEIWPLNELKDVEVISMQIITVCSSNLHTIDFVFLLFQMQGISILFY